jgi:starch-binding outer membrane protein, SusD/RagB family
MSKMTLMKKLSIYLCLLALLGTFSACKKWLDVKPEDKFLEEQVFSTPIKVYQALNSNYLLMARSSLYGANLTSVVPEILAQSYNISTNSSGQGANYSSTNQYSYGILPTVSGIWADAYKVIATANSFVHNLDKYKGVVPAWEDSLLRGEAIAIRAYVHFDLLRLYGPMYSTADSTSFSIPYYSSSGSDFNPFLPANHVMDSITRDLYQAEALLSNDPILRFGVQGDMSIDANVFWQNRRSRLNLYALKALEARMALYRGDKAGAYAAATWLIQNTDGVFPWVTTAQPDRVFTKEVIFGLECRELYESYNKTFVFTALEPQILAPNPSRLTSYMESATYTTDIRNTAFWYQSTQKSYKTFCKFADNTSTVPSANNNIVPMLRKSEMYYIAAECAPDTATAVGYLNTVRTNRLVPALAMPFQGVLTGISSTGVMGEIAKEYRKDLYGEGQMFFYYKRNNTRYIPNGTSVVNPLPAPPAGNGGNSNWIYMDKVKYVFPIPATELEFH